MLIGYARVSTEDQKLRLQHDALTDGGCEKLFREKLSGTSTTLPAREKLLAFARKGDVVVVWKLDRLGRSLRDLIGVVNSLQDRGVGLRSLQEAIDTTTPAGKLTFHIFAALAEFERDMIRERTSAGLAAARKRGVAIGRPRALTPEQILMAEAMTARPRHLNTSGGGAVWYPPLDALSAPQRSSETLRLACKIAPICLIPYLAERPRHSNSRTAARSKLDLPGPSVP